MPVQTSYPLYNPQALPGMRADMEAWNAVSKVNKSTAVIPFGRAVFSDGDDGMRLAAAGTTSAQFIGVTLRELTRAYTDAEIAAGIGAVPNRDAAVFTMGVLWVTAPVAIKKDDPVYVVLSTGQFTNVADGANNILIPNAKFVSTAAAGALVKLSLVVGG